MSRAKVVIGRTIHTKGYVRIHFPGHHRASQTGYVFEHILVAERALGKPLLAKHPVHHHDDDRRNNRGGNLVVCEDNAYHKLLHRRKGALEACGDPSARRCVICGSHDRQDDITVPRSDRPYHRSCAARYQRERRNVSSIFEIADRWWESWRLTRPQLALADVTFDQSHTWHALICAIAGALTWLVLGWWFGPRAWAYGVLAAIAVYALRELAARLEAFVWIGAAWRGRQVVRIPVWFRWAGGRLWDMALDLGKPAWAPGCLALAVLYGQVPAWVVALFALLTAAIAYAYSFGRPRHALFYDGQY